ncbi:MAG TPA: SMP-30/gluconolactonase/LRE family protein [Galbitalea sp.]|jgi:gluconolactonase|nr:SMP-30/gluconolactonase/LRE family protein [Galbitalea sp.]HEX3899044.1 SMP-30/gluconolactonase/LRE family protein [Mycobacteriales bacterium]
MTSPSPEYLESELELLASGYRLAEAPVADDGNTVFFSDVRGGGVYSVVGDDLAQVIPHRKGIGGMVRHVDGGFIVSGRNVSHKGPDGETTIIIDRDAESGRFIFNDLTTDFAGRIYVGAFATNSPWEADEQGRRGSLVMVDLDGRVYTVDDDVEAPNGMSVSADGRSLYVIETGRCLVWRYAIGADGRLEGKERFVDFGEDMPDGMAGTADGGLWVAMARSGAISVIAPDGTITTRLPMPTPMVSSLAFGGPDSRTVYICTGTVPDGEIGGAVYRSRAVKPGLRVPFARIPIETA